MNLTDIRKLIDEATLGPWYPTVEIFMEAAAQVEAEQADEKVWTVGPKIDEVNWSNDSNYPGYGLPLRDAKFIAAARTLMPKLLAVAEAAKRLTDNIAEFDTVTDNCFVDCLDDALAALEADDAAAFEDL